MPCAGKQGSCVRCFGTYYYTCNIINISPVVDIALFAFNSNCNFLLFWIIKEFVNVIIIASEEFWGILILIVSTVELSTIIFKLYNKLLVDKFRCEIYTSRV